MNFVINGEARSFADIGPEATLSQLIAALGLKSDRVAVEWNGTIVRRPDWEATRVASGDKLEVVHFVGGGSAAYGPSMKIMCTSVSTSTGSPSSRCGDEDVSAGMGG